MRYQHRPSYENLAAVEEPQLRAIFPNFSPLVSDMIAIKQHLLTFGDTPEIAHLEGLLAQENRPTIKSIQQAVAAITPSLHVNIG